MIVYNYNQVYILNNICTYIFQYYICFIYIFLFIQINNQIKRDLILKDKYSINNDGENSYDINGNEDSIYHLIEYNFDKNNLVGVDNYHYKNQQNELKYFKIFRLINN